MPRSRPSLRALPLFIIAALGCNGDSLTGPVTGTLQVATGTSGPEPDLDGYTVQVDGGASRAIGVTGSIPSSSVSAGTHTVQLAGLASNCSVAENPRTVSVPAGGTVTVTFEVTCGATGSLVVTAATAGGFPDQDGYFITIDGVNRGAVQPTGDETIAGIVRGSHLVGLGGVAPNCQVNGTNPKTVDLTAGASAPVAFAVDCSAPPPIAFASNRGAGFGIYLVNPDGSGLIKVSPTTLSPDVGVPAWSPDGRRIAVSSMGDLYIMNADGTGLRQFFHHHADSVTATPRWSPDGRTIVFIIQVTGDCPHFCYSNEMWTIQADGTGLKKLADGYNYRWSPDGKRIAYFNDQIFVINADGSGLRQLTSLPLTGDVFEPAWSPDGTRLAFSAGGEIFTINPDGTGLVQVSAGPVGDRGPMWSPDGTRIAFRYPIFRTPWDYTLALALMNADGSGRSALVNLGAASIASLVWAPNGRQIAFTTSGSADPGLNSDVFAINTDGSGLTDVSDNPAFDFGVAWSPR